MKSFASLSTVAALLLLLLFSVAAPGADATCSTRPVLRKYSGYGSTRAAAQLRVSVKVVQKKLNDLDNAGLDVDGYFGPLTDRAVRNWQGDHGLKVDGIVGKNTWASLCSSSSGGGNGGGTGGVVQPGQCDTNNPHGSSKNYNGWTPRSKFVKKAIDTCFSGRFDCKGTTSNRASSEHIGGNALDCYPGPEEVRATGNDLAAGDALAAWLTKNAGSLKVDWVIWQGKIWSLGKSNQGWRTCGTASAGCDGSGHVVNSHYDHLHIKVDGPHGY